MHTITYTGKGFSLNDAYKVHWTRGKKIKDTLKEAFKVLIEKAALPRIEKFRLEVSYNARYDVDNIVPVLKCFVDQLRYCNIIRDDTKKIYTGFSVRFDSNLPGNTYQITIIPLQ